MILVASRRRFILFVCLSVLWTLWAPLLANAQSRERRAPNPVHPPQARLERAEELRLSDCARRLEQRLGLPARQLRDALLAYLRAQPALAATARTRGIQLDQPLQINPQAPRILLLPEAEERAERLGRGPSGGGGSGPGPQPPHEIPESIIGTPGLGARGRMSSPLGESFGVIGPCPAAGQNRRSILCETDRQTTLGLSLGLGQEGFSGAGFSITIPLGTSPSR